MKRPQPKDYNNRTGYYVALEKYCDYLEKNQKKVVKKKEE